jgi:hypothetical protein
MGNAAVAEELPGADELDELYRLDASETETEPEPEDDGDEDDEGEDDTDDGDEKLQPHGIPHP